MVLTISDENWNINMTVITVVNENEILDFLSNLKDKNNKDIKVIENLDIKFDNKSKLDQSKTKELVKDIINSKKSSWPKNEELIGRCKILNLCGKGFTSNVYRAIHEFLGIEVAIKVLSEQLKHDNPEIEAMFLQEAKHTAKLKHPNLVSIFDADKGEKYTYMVMEFVEGYSFEQLLKDGKNIDYKKAVDIMLKLCDALDYALQKGIIHRDIKPGNIMLSHNGDVKLLDLGLSKIVSTSSEENGQIVGTPVYMSPEQFISSNDVDHRADIYSLGATFFHLITGEPPFKSKTFREIISQKIIDDSFIPKLTEDKYPVQLKVIIEKMLARDRDLRFQSYTELKSELEKLNDVYIAEK